MQRAPFFFCVGYLGVGCLRVRCVDKAAKLKDQSWGAMSVHDFARK